MPTTQSPLLIAIDQDAYEWLAVYAPIYLAAIERELSMGRSPLDIRQIVSSNIGPDRQALALRCEQAARHLAAQSESR